MNWSNPTSADLAKLATSHLTPEMVETAAIRRVDSVEGAQIVGRESRNGHNYAGLIFPYFWPGDTHPREYRLRRDEPDLERKADGSIKEKNKYLSPPGKGNLLYFPPDTPTDWLTDTSIPITITEGEKKTLALSRFYVERGEKRLVIGLPGVWNFRGVVGKTTNTNGKRQDVHGVIPDFDRINWQAREVLIVFDVNALTDKNVMAARAQLAQELRGRGAVVHWVDLPTGIPGVNGVDDLLAIKGADYVADLFQTSKELEGEPWESPVPFNNYDLPEFPLDVLPAWLRSYVKELAIATQTPVDMAALSGLTNCSAAIAGNVVVCAREGWIEPTNIYEVTILGVGNRKTAVHDATKAPLEEVEAQLIRDKQASIDDARVERSVLEARLEHLKKAAGKADTEPKRNKLLADAKNVAEELRHIKVPAVPKLIASGDITPEAIASILADQDGRLFLSSDEGELFEMLAGRYGNGSPNFEIILKAHTGGKVRVDRRGRSEVIERATLTIGLTVQPDVLRGLADKPGFRGRGLLARWLYSLPISLVGRRKASPEPVSKEARDAYAKRIKTLAGLGKVEVSGSGELEPRVVRLSKDGLDYLTTFTDEIEPKLAEGGELHPIADWANKLAGAVVRIAAVLHYADHSHSPNDISEIPPNTINRAIQIGRYLIPHAQAAYAEMGADPEVELAKRILRWIEKGAVEDKEARGKYFFRKQDLWQGVKGGAIKKAADLGKGLAILEEHLFIRPAIRDSRRGGKVKVFFEANPAIFTPSPNSPNSPTSDKSEVELGGLGELGGQRESGINDDEGGTI